MKTFFEWISLFKEESATYDQIEDKNMLYKTYYDTYSEIPGNTPWSQSDYEWRAKRWSFFGILPKEGIPPERIGFVTARLKNGVYKLTGMQGPNTKAKIAGLVQLSQTGAPIWGAMDKDFTDRLKKLGFSTPPYKAMKVLLPIIQSDPQFSSGGEWGQLNKDGGIQFDLMGIGQTTKYFTANKQFYQLMIEKMKGSGKIKPELFKLIGKWDSLPSEMKPMALMAAKSMIGLDLDVEAADWLASVA
jgi:hypothetical protein